MIRAIQRGHGPREIYLALRCFFLGAALAFSSHTFAANPANASFLDRTNAPSLFPPMDPAPALPTHFEPTSTTTPDDTRYRIDHTLLRGVEFEVSRFKSRPCHIIFIGDSITANWLSAGKALWEGQYAPRGALDFGVSGDKTQNVLWRLGHLNAADLKPAVAVILIGTNNTHANSAGQIAAGIKAVVAKTKEVFPGTKIILLSLMPRGGPEYRKVIATNAVIKTFADNTTVYYLDLVPLMPPITIVQPDGQTDTNYKGLYKDHLHPDASGYMIWHDAMEPLLAKLLGDGK